MASRPLIPILDPATFEQSMELEHPLELLEPLAFLLSRFLNELCEALDRNGLSTNQAEVTLSLEDKSEFVRAVQLPTPTTDANVLWKLLQYDLAAHPPHAPILKVHLRLVPVPPAVLQHGLFLPQAPEPQKFELILARITAIVGEGNAGTPELLNTHRPGAYRMVKFGTSKQSARSAPDEPHLAIRLFRPALPANVVVDRGRPRKVSAKGVAGVVSAWAGPWRTSGDWWTSDPWCRDEWDIALENGAYYRIYYEPGRGWFVDGNYD
jgi:protein ImuB